MSSTPKPCYECHNGVMKKPFPIHSYDFNEEGRVPPYCDNCGRGYPERIIIPTLMKTRIHNRCIKYILSVLCNGGLFFSYKTKDLVYYELKQENHYHPYNLARAIVQKLYKNKIQLDFNFVENTIYIYFDSLSFT